MKSSILPFTICLLISYVNVILSSECPELFNTMEVTQVNISNNSFTLYCNTEQVSIPAQKKLYQKLKTKAVENPSQLITAMYEQSNMYNTEKTIIGLIINPSLITQFKLENKKNKQWKIFGCMY